MPTYPHQCLECNYEWDEFYSINDPIPEFCPQCGKTSVKRLIGGGSGKGIVELTGHELTAKLKDDANKLKKEMQTNENLKANFVGESKFEQTKTYNEKVKKEANYIKRQFRRVK